MTSLNCTFLQILEHSASTYSIRASAYFNEQKISFDITQLSQQAKPLGTPPSPNILSFRTFYLFVWAWMESDLTTLLIGRIEIGWPPPFVQGVQDGLETF